MTVRRLSSKRKIDIGHRCKESNQTFRISWKIFWNLEERRRGRSHRNFSFSRNETSGRRFGAGDDVDVHVHVDVDGGPLRSGGFFSCSIHRIVDLCLDWFRLFFLFGCLCVCVDRRRWQRIVGRRRASTSRSCAWPPSGDRPTGGWSSASRYKIDGPVSPIIQRPIWMSDEPTAATIPVSIFSLSLSLSAWRSFYHVKTRFSIWAKNSSFIQRSNDKQ